MTWVGLGGLEPPASSLSGSRHHSLDWAQAAQRLSGCLVSPRDCLSWPTASDARMWQIRKSRWVIGLVVGLGAAVAEDLQLTNGDPCAPAKVAAHLRGGRGSGLPRRSWS